MSQDECRAEPTVSVNGAGVEMSGDDPRMITALEEYLAALEGGRQLDREEFLARHREIAAALAEGLAGLDFVHAAGPQAARSKEATPSDGSAPLPDGLPLGDFRIIRQIGKGGMGVVYEAEQLSLRRRVALKVLPFAATMDPRQLQRFHNEAQAAGCLHHTNIVPVYFVGCERGVHFYAMQFIDGQPLNELIQQLRQAEKTLPTAGEERTTAYQPSPGEVDATPTVQAAGDATPLTREGKRGWEYTVAVPEPPHRG
jgi:hypothetical protein